MAVYDHLARVVGVDLTRRPTALDTAAVSTRALSPQYTPLLDQGGGAAQGVESIESVTAELAVSSVTDAANTETAAVQAGAEAGVEAEVWAAFVAAAPSWRHGDGELGERLSRGAAVRTS